MHVAGLVAAGFLLLAANREQWFFADEWDFVAERSVFGESRLGIFDPHNEHWSTLPLIAYRGAFGIFGLEAYWPYVLILICLHLGLAHVLWRLCEAAGASLWVSTALVLLFTVLGAGAENLLWAFQSGFVGSLFFGASALLLLATQAPPNPRRQLPVAALLVASLASSGVGMTMLFAVSVAIVLRRWWRLIVILVVVPASVFAVWYVTFGRENIAAGAGRNAFLFFDAAKYVGYGLAGSLSQTLHLPSSAGVAAFVLLLGHFCRRHREWTGVLAVPISGLSAAVFFFAVAALGRASLGMGQAAAERYVYVCIALMLPAIAVGLTALATHRRGQQGVHVMAAAIAALALVNLSSLFEAAGAQAEEEQKVRRLLQASAVLVRSGEPIDRSAQLDPTAPNLNVPSFRALVRRGGFDGGLPSRTDLTTARGRLQLAFAARNEPAPAGHARLIVSAGAVSTPPTLEGCVRVSATADTPQIVVESPGPADRLSLTASESGVVTIFPQTVDGQSTGLPRQQVAEAGQGMEITFLGGLDRSIIGLPPGTTSICGFEPEATSVGSEVRKQ